MSKRKSNLKRIMSLFLTVAMLLTAVPFTLSASADDPLWDDVVVPTGTTVLTSFRRTAIPTNADENAGSNTALFKADTTGGVFNAGSTLTAWDYNQQRQIGAAGSRTPIVMENGQLNTSTGGHTGWKTAKAAGIGLVNASAFQIKTETTGFSDLKFSAKMKTSGSFGETASGTPPEGTFVQFGLAYSLDGDNWTEIPNSTQNVVKWDSNTYEALEWSFVNTRLPEELNNKGDVYLRVFLNTSENFVRGGNASINDIIISEEDDDDDDDDMDFFPPILRHFPPPPPRKKAKKTTPKKGKG
jgi:hypothetical protein